MKVGIVGFAGSGKTTVFNTLTGLSAEVGGYGARDKVNLGVIKVPDARIEKLAEIYNPRKKVYAEINFVDFAGPEGGADRAGASSLDAKLVPQMREAEALVQVVRGFDNAALNLAVDPVRDVQNFESELILADLVLVENRLNRFKKEKADPREKEVIERCFAQLESEKPLRELDLSAEDQRFLLGFRFLSQKPVMLLYNVGEDRIAAGAPAPLTQLAQKKDLKLITMCGQAEMEIAQLEAEEQQAFLDDLGIKEPARERFIKSAYSMLDLISFLTAGEDECRAWTIKRGTNAQKAAGKIHSDIERGFIRAEVVAFDDLIACGSEAKCREQGKLRLEGKEYTVSDGDIINFRFNV
jgi:GTP-binding protein YchF